MADFGRAERKAKRRGYLIVGVAVLIIMIGLIAYGRGWLKPVDPSIFMRLEPGSYKVKTVLDGDTIIVDMQGTDETVRFIGIDTPETHKPDNPVECYGPNASEHTKKRIGDNRVRLVADHLTTNRDRYNRLLRYVILPDGKNLNSELVEQGYAFAYAFPFAESQKFAQSQKQAKSQKLGLWGSCQPYQDPATGQWHSNALEDTSTNPVP